MDYRSLHIKTVAELRQIAKDEGIKIPAGTKKPQIVEIILEKIQAEESIGAAKLVPVSTAPKAPAEPVGAAPEASVESVGSAPEASVEPVKTAESSAQPVRRGRPGRAAVAKPAAVTAEKAEATAEISTQGSAAEAPAPEERPAAKDIQNPAYHRPMSTQQRMGARTHPTMGGAVRPQAPARNVPSNRPVRTDAPRPRIARSYDAPQRRTNVNAANADEQPVRRTAAQPEAARLNDENRTAAEDYRAVNPLVPDILASGECGDGAGILEIHADGYGFLRAENYLPGNRDVYVSAAQIRRFNLRTGDYVVGKTRSQQAGDRSVGLIFISEVNGQTPDAARKRVPFDALVPVYPDERLRMEHGTDNDLSLRLIDLLAPIGKGQRGMIVSPPKAGKTTLLKKIANAITANNPDVHLIVLLIDERPEEVTDMKRSIQGEVVYSTFDEAPENHTRVSEMVLERAQRLVETGKDVVVLLDSITRLARAYNLVIPPTGRSLSGGLDPGALYRPKRFFGAARNIENGGSLTIIATALVDTGSRMDDIIFEEFKGTGNMELHLDRSLSDRRIFPAIDMYKSGTRREELLLTPAELEGAYQVRRMLSKGGAQEASEQMIGLIDKSSSNAEFLLRVKNWSLANRKDGYR